MNSEEQWIKHVEELQNYAHEVAGEWDGDNAGTQEDRAHIALDIMEKTSEVIDLLNEMGNV